jgi:hypothetical protein
MKSKLFILSTLCLLLLLNGCAVKPEATVSSYFDELKTTISSNLDSIEIQDYFDSEVKLSDTEQDLDLNNDESNEMTARYMELFQGFEYTIKESVVEGDTATVSVEIVTYPIGELLSNYVVQLLSKAFEWAFSGISEEEMELRTTNLFLELSADLEKTYTKTIPVYLVKKDGEWLLVGGDTNFEMFNAITGGLLDFAKQFQEDIPESNG